jgi:hypothetical protein
MAGQNQFVMRSGPTVGKVYPLDAQEVTIGRDSTNVVAINDAEISRRHARMELRGSAYVIQDLGSTNGTFVNGIRISGMQVLNPGDSVSFGEGIVLAYEPVADMNATVHSARAPRTGAQKPAPVPAPIPAPIPVRAPAWAPPPAPVYSGQVPASPIPMPAATAPAKKSGNQVIIIVVAAIVVCLILGCVATLLYVDADKTGMRWCTFPISIFAKLLGAACP